MASKQKRRTPRNIYTEKRAEREFQEFIRHSQHITAPSGLPQATEDNQTSLKRRRFSLPDVQVRQISFYISYN